MPNLAADRWPPGMAPPSSTPSAPKPQPKPRPAAPAPAQPAAPAAVPKAQPVTPQTTAKPASAVPASPVDTQPAQALPVVAVPVATPLESVVPHETPSDPSAENPLDDIAAMLDFEQSAPATARPLESNPYQSPRASERPTRKNGEVQRIRYGETMRTTWAIFKAKLGSCIGATVIVMIGFGLAHGLLIGAILAFAQVVVALKIGSVALANSVVVFFVSVNLLVLTYLTLGYCKFMLQLARGKPAEVSMLIDSLPLLWPGVGVFLLMFLAVGMGTFLLIVPGIFVAILLSLAPLALVDKEEGVLAALGLSAKLMMHNLLPVFLLLFPVILIGNLLSTVTCGLGGLITAPFQTLLAAVIYLHASGRQTAVD